jgi:hypothetical protein
MEKSITIKWGCKKFAWSIASRPFSASPHTSKSASRLNASQSACRTSGLSSTTRTLLIRAYAGSGSNPKPFRSEMARDASPRRTVCWKLCRESRTINDGALPAGVDGPAWAPLRMMRGMLLFSTCSSSSAKQVNDQNHQPHNQQQVDQASAHMQTETQKPQNHKNNKNRPKHINLPHARGNLITSAGELFRADR